MFLADLHHGHKKFLHFLPAKKKTLSKLCGIVSKIRIFWSLVGKYRTEEPTTSKVCDMNRLPTILTDNNFWLTGILSQFSLNNSVKQNEAVQLHAGLHINKPVCEVTTLMLPWMISDGKGGNELLNKWVTDSKFLFLDKKMLKIGLIYSPTPVAR